MEKHYFARDFGAGIQGVVLATSPEAAKENFKALHPRVSDAVAFEVVVDVTFFRATDGRILLTHDQGEMMELCSLADADIEYLGRLGFTELKDIEFEALCHRRFTAMYADKFSELYADQLQR